MLRAAMSMLIAMAATSCGGGDDEPSCRSTVNHFYGKGCALFDEEGMIHRREMTSMCEESRQDAAECGCTAELGNVMECWNDVRSDRECGMCDSEFEALVWCFYGC